MNDGHSLKQWYDVIIMFNNYSSFRFSTLGPNVVEVNIRINRIVGYCLPVYTRLPSLRNWVMLQMNNISIKLAASRNFLKWVECVCIEIIFFKLWKKYKSGPLM